MLLLPGDNPGSRVRGPVSSQAVPSSHLNAGVAQEVAGSLSLQTLVP